jgi:prephenate dehydratase
MVPSSEEYHPSCKNMRFAHQPGSLDASPGALAAYYINLLKLISYPLHQFIHYFWVADRETAQHFPLFLDNKTGL